MFQSIHPATGQTIETFEVWSDDSLYTVLEEVRLAGFAWRQTPVNTRAERILCLRDRLLNQSETLAPLITQEMGKTLTEARREISKCADLMTYYGTEGPGLLSAESVPMTGARVAIQYEPLGTILAIMPWNFPFWQVFRAAIPILLSGNTLLLKHAPSTQGCARAIETLCVEAGFPARVLTWLPIDHQQTEALLRSAHVQGLTFTGSESTGRRLGGMAAAHLKKCVLELGGSDPLIVLDDADLNPAIEAAVSSRFQVAGQVCVATKRIILLPGIAERFIEGFLERTRALGVGDPMLSTSDMGPMARDDLRLKLQFQIDKSLALGAVLKLGGSVPEGPGFFYPPTVIDHVRPGMPAFDEETFGPLAALIRAEDESDALRLANLSPYGLGASLWTSSTEKAHRFSNALECGMVFVNAITGSHPEVPFGGIKHSGFGRELGRAGLMEFVNAKTVWVHQG